MVPNYDIRLWDNNCQDVVVFFRGGGGSIHEAFMPCWTGPGFLVCWRWRFVVSAVGAELNRRGRSFVWGFCQSPEPLCLWLHLPPIWKTPSFSYTPSTPVCQQGTAPSSSVYPLYPNAFLQGRLLFIPSGGLTVNLLHWGKFLGTGPGSVGILPQPLVLGPSLYIYVSLLLSVYPNKHPTPHATSPFGLLFQSGPFLRDEYLARLQLPFISSYSKLKDSIKGPLYCQKVSPPPPLFLCLSVPFIQEKKEVLGPSDGLVWAICRLESSVSASLLADICSDKNIVK